MTVAAPMSVRSSERSIGWRLALAEMADRGSRGDRGPHMDPRSLAGGAVRSQVVDVRLLGSLELSGEDGPIALSTPKLRTLFVVFALHPNDVVAEGRLIDALWGEAAPRTAEKTLQNHILRLRRVLRAGGSRVRIETRPGGHRHEVAPHAL